MSASLAQTPPPPNLLSAIPPPPLGQVRGMVLGEDGKGIAGVLVNAVSFPRPAVAGKTSGPPLRPASSTTRTAADGSYLIGGLPPAYYRVCTPPPQSDLVDPCMWEAAPKTSAVVVNQTAAAPSLVLVRGERLKILVDDPGGFLDAHEGRTPGAAFFVGVRTPGGNYLPMGLTAKEPSARTYEALVPHSTHIGVSVSSGFFQVNDAAGKAITPGQEAATPVQFTAGVPPAPVRFTITGTSAAPAK